MSGASEITLSQGFIALSPRVHPNVGRSSPGRPTLWKSPLTSRYIGQVMRPRSEGGESAAEAQLDGPRPKVGTAVLVAHALGAGAVPADLEGAGFEVVVVPTGSPPLLRCAPVGPISP